MSEAFFKSATSGVLLGKETFGYGGGGVTGERKRRRETFAKPQILSSPGA